MSINVGVLGFAHGHVGVYCDAWAASPELGVRVLAGWDHDVDRGGRAVEARRLRAFTTPEALLREGGVDGVLIGAETSLHAELVEQAAAAGKRIILQKPLALTLEQADRIVAAVERHGTAFTVAWQMRVDPQNLQMKQMIDSGVLGRVYMIRRRHGLSTHVWPGFENSWHVKPELNRGMWADDASHAVDFLLWLRGRPVSVMAEIATLRDPRVPDDHGIAVFRYADGTFAEVASSFVCLAGENTTEIVGEEGVIIQNYGDGPSCQVPHPPGGLKWFKRGANDWTVSPIVSPANHAERIRALAPELGAFLHGRRGPICTAQEGRASLRMTLACYESAARGCRITI
jgi:predicted dehydrogenase